MNATAKTNPIKLTRTESGWKFGSILITKHQWVLPHAGTSYRAVIDGVLTETDTLREMRECIEESQLATA
jgi:hypothetical protein